MPDLVRGQDPFVHLHVASSYSLRYGAASPPALAQKAADLEMDALAVTDRDGVYGAVKFARACQRVGIRPVLGADMAVVSGRSLTSAAAGRPPDPPYPVAHVPSRRPVRGGSDVDPRLPRATLLARGATGWARLCRLVSAAHRLGGRGTPVLTPESIGDHVDGLFVVLGPESEVGRALAVRRPDRARALVRRWLDVVPPDSLLLEAVDHRTPGGSARASAMVSLADDCGVGAVVTNAVRYLDRPGAAVVDVLDAIRRLVPLDGRHVDRSTSEGYLKSGKEMAEIGTGLARHLGERRVRRLLAGTRSVAERCAVDPAADLGLGEVHFPELEVAALGASDSPGTDAAVLLRTRCEEGMARRGLTDTASRDRLREELEVIAALGYPTYFLTVAEIVGIIRSRGIRCAARGSGAGSLVAHVLGISDVDPVRHGLLMERFLSPLRRALPDVDIDVESARRLEVYQAVMDRFGTERSACVSMMETYRARHAIRDVGAALGMPPGEIDSIAKAFPHIRANQVRTALRELPELRSAALAAGAHEERMAVFYHIVEQLDGLPRHIAMHPCGLILSDSTLLDRTPVESSALGFPMSQFDKDDVEDLGLLKLDLLGIRMQSAIAHALVEIERVEGVRTDIDAVPRDDPGTFELIRSTRTLGCFQIESPGQRELVGKFAPESFDDIIIDISLFRPGPVKSDMVTPFLEARQGWRMPSYPHPDLEPILRETCGVVVFHEQILRMVSVLSGCTLAEADEVRRRLGDPEGQDEVRAWFRPAAVARGYSPEFAEKAWEILRSFGSFGFCKAHAAAFAVPTYQSAWLKAHHPAAFFSGVLTHDPGMYPKRLLLDDARQFGVAVLGLDVNRSDVSYRVERVAEVPPGSRAREDHGRDPTRRPWGTEVSAGEGYGIRLAYCDVKGMSEDEALRAVAGRPYASLADFWQRSGVSRPVVERLVITGAFDSVHHIGAAPARQGHPGVTRRDLLLQIGDLDAWSRRGNRGRRTTRSASVAPVGARSRWPFAPEGPAPEGPAPGRPDAGRHPDETTSPSESTATGPRSCFPSPPGSAVPVQLSFGLGEEPPDVTASGLPEMSDAEQVTAELEVLGMDASGHVLSFDEPLLSALGVVRSRDLLLRRSRARILVAGVKVATQTPPVRSGRRVIFATLDDATGPVDVTFFEDVQDDCAATVFHSWMLLVAGVLRRTGPRGVSIRATACWDLAVVRDVWSSDGPDAVRALVEATGPRQAGTVAGDGRGRRTLVHPTGFRMSPYADLRPAGSSPSAAPRRLWHASPGSAGG